MDLSKPTTENMKYILEQLAEKLDVANRMIMDEKDYDLNRYDDLKFMYDMVLKKPQLSINEKHAFIDELRSVRK